MPKIYVLAGEASGDLHGGNLILALKKVIPDLQLRGWGGEQMQAAGMELVKHYKELAFMGFTEVISNLPTILQNFKACKRDITAFQPDLLLLIDYPGFNLRMAKWAKNNGIRVVYFISPQVWAWKESRVKSIRKHVDKMLVILPFEKPFYEEKWQYPVDYVGHPLVEIIDRFLATKPNPPADWLHKKIIAVLPGSRKQEIRQKLPLMLAITDDFPDHHFVVGMAPGLDASYYEPFIQQRKNVSFIQNQTYLLLAHAQAALVTSGTATLETALFGVPEIICYKGNPVSYQIAKRLIHISYIGLANLIMNKPMVKELIQHELTPQNLRRELHKLLFDESERERIEADYALLRSRLTEGGNASENAARIIATMFATPTD